MKPNLFAFAALLLTPLAPLAALRAADAAKPPVEIFRDPWGTPHVFAAAEADSFFGLGHAAAEDRLLQMELIRRKAAGRLAEVFGPDWVDADREARIAGHAAYAPRAFTKLPGRWQDALRAYAAGVNAWSQANPEAVTRRFQTLGIQPEPWTPADCLVAARGILSLGSPFNAAPVEEYHRFRELVAQVGETEAARQSGMAIDDSVAIVSESEMAKHKTVYERLKQRARMPGLELRGAGGGGEPRKMSHAWAVSGRRSTTGKPILESDPQLTLSSPPFFYEVHLAAGRIDARGLGIPGCPGLFIGWNRRLAWGASALGADSPVIFLDRLTPNDKGYLFQEKPVQFERRLERIEVKGGQPVLQEVLTSRHGTVFNSLVRQPRADEAYLCYDAQTMDDGASARMMLEVLDAVKGWDLHEGTTDRFPAARGLRNTLTPYRGAGLQNVYGAGVGGISHLAREVGARFTRDSSTPTNALVRAYLVNWLRASASGGAGRGAASDAWTARMSQGRTAAAREAGRTITIPCQRTIPHNLPVVDPSLDIVSPPLTCLDQGTIWSQPGNLYSQIVDLADVDNSRSMMAPGNAEDGPFPHGSPGRGGLLHGRGVDSRGLDDLLRVNLHASGLPESVSRWDHDLARPSMDGTDGAHRDSGGPRLR